MRKYELTWVFVVFVKDVGWFLALMNKESNMVLSLTSKQWLISNDILLLDYWLASFSFQVTLLLRLVVVLQGESLLTSILLIFYLTLQSARRADTILPDACRDADAFVHRQLGSIRWIPTNSTSHSVLCELYKWARMVCCWLDVSVWVIDN